MFTQRGIQDGDNGRQDGTYDTEGEQVVGISKRPFLEDDIGPYRVYPTVQ